jgi:phosphoribosylaminoimidazolecarboxamide formyltransferase/IMP cyclohydrolase
VLTRTLDVETAKAMVPYYFEVVCAPDYEGEALDILKKWKNLRILQIKEIERLQAYKTRRNMDFNSLMAGGSLLQESQPLAIRGKEDLKPARTTYKGEIHEVKARPRRASLRTCSSAGTSSRG